MLMTGPLLIERYKIQLKYEFLILFSSYLTIFLLFYNYSYYLYIKWHKS